jgi:hypothetical protein
VRDNVLEAHGFAHYADIIRRGERDVYAASRLYDRHWTLHGPDAEKLLRRSAVILIEDDPWFLATSIPFFLGDALTRRDIERLTPKVAAGVAAGAAAYLRAKLWFHGLGRSGREKAAVRRTLALLREVPRPYRQLGWLEMIVGCHEQLGAWKDYTRVFPRLFTATNADWRSSPLRRMLEIAAKRRDWRIYDRWRPEWDKLPPTRHTCECEKNAVATMDGLRAAAAERWEDVPRHLSTAADVAGCPHLNSGGLRLDLVRMLVSRRRYLGDCRIYLDRAAQFHLSKDLSAIRRSLDRARQRRSRSRSHGEPQS